MPSAIEYAGIAQGIANIPAAIDQSQLRQMQLSEAKSRQQKAQMELQEFAANAPLRKQQSDLMMQQLEAQTRATNTQSLNTTTMSAFDRFEADGNIRHLNTWLADAKRNPIGANIYGPVARYDNVTKTESNDKLLRQAGYNPDDVYGDPDIADDLIVVTQSDGTQSLLTKETMYATTGYAKYLDDQQLTQLERKARINQALRSGQTKSKVTLQERVANALVESNKAADIAEAYKMLKDMEASGNGSNVMSSAEERAVARIMEEDTSDYVTALAKYYSIKRQGTGSTNESRYIDEYMQNNTGATYEEAAANYRNLAKTSTQKEIADVKELRKGLDSMNWLETKLTDMPMTERAKIYRDYISPLEDLRGFKLSTEDKRTVRNLRDLTALGGKAGTELTPEETGLLDSTLNDFKKYVSNEVGGKKATSAYETFRNIFRNALYGASLTDTEVKAFNRAAGSLGQQLQPVLAQLQTQMDTIKNNLESIRDTNDPDIAHYYLGEPIEDIDVAIAAIEDRLNDPRLLFKNKGQSIKVRAVDKTTLPTAPIVNGGEKKEFDFDAAMKEAGL